MSWPTVIQPCNSFRKKLRNNAHSSVVNYCNYSAVFCHFSGIDLMERIFGWCDYYGLSYKHYIPLYSYITELTK